MPFYEFYCKDCHRIFTFYSRRVNTEKIPQCPRCSAGLRKLLSEFHTSRRGGEEGSNELGIDEGRLMNALYSLEREAEGVDENNPKEVARLMRKFTQMTGLRLGDRWEEALERLSSGEDLESIEDDLAEGLDEEEPIAVERRRRFPRFRPPERDEGIYEL